MHSFFRFFLISILLLSFSTLSFAQQAQFLVVPDCLLAKHFPYELLGKEKDLRLIKTSKLKEFQAVRVKLPFYCRGFINVTEEWQHNLASKNKDVTAFLQSYLPALRPSDFTRRYKIQNKEKVTELLQRIDPKLVSTNLNLLANLPDRYVNSDSGVYASKWIKQQLKSIAKASGRDDIAIYTLATNNHARQASVVIKIGKELNEPGIVMGAHMDTIDSTNEYQPGADDDASGAVTLLETARVLLESDMQFNKPIYLIWYAGEEAGKLGSQSVVQNFNRNTIAVDSVLQLDGVGYVGKELGIGLMDDFTDAGLTAFVADLVGTYLKLPVGAVRCGYACSDHFTWYQNGNRVAYPFSTMDDEGNLKVHTRKDTVDSISLDHIMDFVRLSLAFAVELAGPKI